MKLSARFSRLPSECIVFRSGCSLDSNNCIVVRNKIAYCEYRNSVKVSLPPQGAILGS